MDTQHIFVGGIFLPEQMDEIRRDTVAAMQNAADALQKALLKGLSQGGRTKLAVVNLPFVGPYPHLYRRRWFPSLRTTIFNGVEVHGMGFCNTPFTGAFTRFLGAFSGLRKARGSARSVVFVYSAHLPFVLASFAFKCLHDDVKLCLIVPDLPEFMGEYAGTYRLLMSMQSAIFGVLARKADYHVLVTRFMAERLRIEAFRHVVVEGIFDPDGIGSRRMDVPADGARRIVLYSGTLARRYGILDLLAAFERMKDADIRLWICGFGDSSDAVVALARRDRRVRFFGELPREEVAGLQARAHVLVNPRPPGAEFTRYSFPSKTMEYLGTGRPVVMHALPGVPGEYLPYLITPPTPDGDGLERALRRAIDLSDVELDALGRAGRDFVLRNKTPELQAAAILELVGSRVQVAASTPLRRGDATGRAAVTAP